MIVLTDATLLLRLLFRIGAGSAGCVGEATGVKPRISVSKMSGTWLLYRGVWGIEV